MNNRKTEYQQMVEVMLGNRTLQVPQNGIYDRYRMNTDLTEIEKMEDVTSVDFFRKLPKTEVDSPIGKTLTPNYYYRLHSARVVMTASERALRKRLPKGLEPLTILPGVGLVSVMFFYYDICDIDSYGETAVGIPVRPPRHKGSKMIDLASGLKNEDMYVHVLSLPVTTDIAQVRGHDGYGFPKWVTGIELDVRADKTFARVYNSAGKTDVELLTPTPKLKAGVSGEHVTTMHSLIQRDGNWTETLSQLNVLSLGKAVMPKNVTLKLGKGRISDDLRSVKAGRIIELEVSDNSQLALHMPQPISIR